MEAISLKLICNYVQRLYNYFFAHPSDYLDELIRRGLVVGENFKMLGDVIIDNAHTWHIKIGNDVTLAPRVHILAHDASTLKYLHYVRVGKVIIGNRVFVGAGSIILPGVTIGDDVIIGAGSLVSHDIPKEHVAAGNPARIICTIEKFIARKRNEMQISPCFGEEYTFRKNVSPKMKDIMNREMKNNIGYIV
ncbi:MAG: acyltransferase [Candidatus Electrothrix sp. LOE2]|nr:acyltransferase [Candidatus Electrothrix sp. LOE2]